MKLPESEIVKRLERLDGWKRDDEKWISRKYRFRAFPDAIQFVNRIAETAERLKHHPMIAIDYRVVTLRLTTWKAGGLTGEDFASAEEYDRLYQAIADPAAKPPED
jgi:4a-hydroxytetrahydrobiopterin dehydratase